MTAPTRTSLTLPVEPGVTAADHTGATFPVDRVVHEAYVHDGEVWQIVTAYAADHRSVTWDLARDDAPEWVPQPPPELLAIVAAIRGGAR